MKKMSLQDREQQNKEWEEFYYPEMADKMIEARLVIQNGSFKGAIITITKEAVKELMTDYASEQCRKRDELISKIPQLLNDSLGYSNDSLDFHSYHIRPLNKEWWIFHNGVGSGEPLKQWIEGVINKLKKEIDGI